MVTVIEVPQEHALQGLARAELDAYFADLDAQVRAVLGRPVSHPQAHYWVRDVEAHDRCPWGYSWFREDASGHLQLWQAHWDSSG